MCVLCSTPILPSHTTPTLPLHTILTLPSHTIPTSLYTTSIHLCTQAINATMARAKCYHTMDAFVKLVVVLVRFSGDTTNTITKVNLLNKVKT